MACPTPNASPPLHDESSGILRLCHSSCPPHTAEVRTLPGLPALVVVGVSGKVGKAAIRGIRTHCVKGLSPLSTLELLRSCRAIRTQTHALALLLSRFRFDYGVKPKVQAAPQYAERGRSNGALPPATLAAEEDGGG